MSQRTNERTPRWVKMLGVIIIVLILLLAVTLVTDIGGPHGPDRHTPSDSESGALPAVVKAGVMVIGRGFNGPMWIGGGPG